MNQCRHSSINNLSAPHNAHTEFFWDFCSVINVKSFFSRMRSILGLSGARFEIFNRLSIKNSYTFVATII